MLGLFPQSINGWLHPSFFYIVDTRKYTCLLYAIMLISVHSNATKSMQCSEALPQLANED